MDQAVEDSSGESLLPVDAISAVVCTPEYSIQPWIVDLVNGSTKPLQLQAQRVRNLDITQPNTVPCVQSRVTADRFKICLNSKENFSAFSEAKISKIMNTSIAIQNCLNQLPSAPPLSLSYGLLMAQHRMPFLWYHIR